MRFFTAVDALPSLESMKFPVFSLLAGNFGLFRDEFAADSPLQRRVCELSVPAHHATIPPKRLISQPSSPGSRSRNASSSEVNPRSMADPMLSAIIQRI